MQETSIATAPDRAITPEYQQAMDLHHQILASAETAATAMISLCKSLKRMRDEQLYSQLGYESFEDYTEKAVGLKRRQAYNYIAVLEKLPAHLLQSNAHIGITKLELLAQVPALDREEFLEGHDLDGMSARELREMVDKIKDQGDQISLLQSELDAAGASEQELERLRQELERARVRADELEQRPVDVAVQEPDEETLERIRKDARAAVEAETAAKVREAEKAAREKAEKQLVKARQEAAREAEERFRASLAAIEGEKAQALERAAEMERQLKIAGDTDAVLFKFHFDELQRSYGEITAIIEKKRSDNPETAAKYEFALVRALDALKSNLSEETDDDE